MGTQLQAVVLALAAFESDAILEALEVDDHSVALLGLPVYGHQPGSAVDVGLKLGLHVGICHLDIGLGSGHALVVLDLDLRLDSHHCLKGKAVLAHLLNLQLGVGHRLNAGLLQSSGIGGGVRLLDGVLIEHLSAIHSLHHLPGCLALAEAGQGDVLLLPIIDLVDGGVELVGPHLDDQLNGAVFFLFVALDVHVVNSSVRTISPHGSGPL